MADQKAKCKSPMDPTCMSSLKHWGKPPTVEQAAAMKEESSIDCGWGRLIFGQTYDNPEKLARMIRGEKKGRRDIAMYMRDPHVVLSYAPQELFLDPSLTYRLDFHNYRENGVRAVSSLVIRSLKSGDDENAINTIYQAWGMVPSYSGFYQKALQDQALTVLVAEDPESGDIVGAVTGVDHFRAFHDPDNGSSLWALAVDQQCRIPKVGEALVRSLIIRFMEAGRRFLDLSVMHTNSEAIALYEKLGFEQVPVYVIKKKNPINERLYLGPDPEGQLNIYARIITDEARRRGIGVEVLDAENGYFQLCLGGRKIVCRESLSELTSAVAMSRCDDKVVTRRVLQKAGLRVPEQIEAGDGRLEDFLQLHPRIVVKPARGEQGAGVSVDLEKIEEIEAAIKKAQAFCEKVICEEYVRGEDLRIIVIDYEVVAAAVRRPAQIRGTGELSIRQLIEKQSRRRAAATHGESTIPFDEETLRTVAGKGYELDTILPEGVELLVRKTANLHTGGTIHDVTAEIHPELGHAAVEGAKALQLPVVGFDFLVPDIKQPDYVIIEANERPGLANHEPQPTAGRFIDLLFPQSKYDMEGS